MELKESVLRSSGGSRRGLSHERRRSRLGGELGTGNFMTDDLGRCDRKRLEAGRMKTKEAADQRERVAIKERGR